MRRWLVVSAVLEAGAVGCLVVAYTNREFETVSYTPLTLEPTNWFSPFSWSDPYLWLGAGVALACVGIVVLVVARFARAAR